MTTDRERARQRLKSARIRAEKRARDPNGFQAANTDYMRFYRRMKKLYVNKPDELDFINRRLAGLFDDNGEDILPQNVDGACPQFTKRP